MKVLFILCLLGILSNPVYPSPLVDAPDVPPADSSTLRTGAGTVVYSWQGLQNEAPTDCNKSEKFTSKLALTTLSGNSNLFGKGNHARIEYYLTLGDRSVKIIDVKTKDMKFLYSTRKPPTYDTIWLFKLAQTLNPSSLGTGYTVEGFYHSRGELELVADGKKTILEWQSDGDGFRIDSSHFKLYGQIYPTTIDESVGYCLMKWKDQ